MSKEKPGAPKKPAAKSEHKKPEKPQKSAAHPSADKQGSKKAAAKESPKKQAKPRKSAVRPTEHAPDKGAEKAEQKRIQTPRAGAARPPRRATGFRANVSFQRISPTKVRRIADHLRRKPYVEAIALLDVLPHKGARLLRKVIQSAAANALAQNKGLDEQMLFVKELLVDGGPTMKRMWARGRGRADRLLKRSCHIFVVVDEIGRKEVDNGSKG
jgi:large subunit ribosomal protein L22